MSICLMFDRLRLSRECPAHNAEVWSILAVKSEGAYAAVRSIILLRIARIPEFVQDAKQLIMMPGIVQCTRKSYKLLQS